jgi:prepilin-type N-terminal cleavage/methylation domain-containing protein
MPVKLLKLDAQPPYFKAGFTLIELVVVLGIMAIMLSLVLANIGGTREARNMRIAQNELVTALRKIQSYTLSSRNINNDQPVNYYLIKFDYSKPTQYTIQAIYNVSSAPKLADVETIKFPGGVRLAFSNPITIYRSASPTTQVPASCTVFGFLAPFAKAYFADGCTITSPPSIVAGDDYKQILDFVSNTASYPVSTDSNMVIRLSNTAATLSSKVLVKGVIGSICPTVDELTCSY